MSMSQIFAPVLFRIPILFIFKKKVKTFTNEDMEKKDILDEKIEVVKGSGSESEAHSNSIESIFVSSKLMEPADTKNDVDDSLLSEKNIRNSSHSDNFEIQTNEKDNLDSMENDHNPTEKIDDDESGTVNNLSDGFAQFKLKSKQFRHHQHQYKRKKSEIKIVLSGNYGGFIEVKDLWDTLGSMCTLSVPDVDNKPDADKKSNAAASIPASSSTTHFNLASSTGIRVAGYKENKKLEERIEIKNIGKDIPSESPFSQNYISPEMKADMELEKELVQWGWVIEDKVPKLNAVKSEISVNLNQIEAQSLKLSQSMIGRFVSQRKSISNSEGNSIY